MIKNKCTNKNFQLKIVKLTNNATTPTKATSLAAGCDLYSAYDYNVPALGKLLVKTDLVISVPPGTYGRIAPRSSIALNHFIAIGAGVIDEDYRGNVSILVFNHSDTIFTIKKGDRIAQLICEKIEHPNICEVTSLDKTTRGEKGFGSTEKSFFIFR